MNKDKSASSSLSELSIDEVVVVDEIDHYSEEWIPPFAFREGISLNRRQKIIDFYKFEEPIGEGKFGRVFKCIEKATQLCLAAKCIKIKKDSELKQVENEISILTKMRHKCIAQIYDAYYTENNFEKEVILIMEIVEGGELFDRVVEDSYILTELAIALITHQICEAIKYIHYNNFIHLDLKPENIMCVSQSSNQIKLIDFGLAQHYDGEHDLLFMAGTPEFAAPEVIKYEPLNFHTDMWSVGVITYILLSGQSPFLGPNIAITYNKVEKGDWSFCDEFETNNISQEAKDFISKLLIVKKEDRMLPEDCLIHSWLKNSLDKAHNLQNKKDGSLNIQPICKEKLKNYLKNKKFRKIVFGVLFINQVLKMITTMQLKKNKKGLLYAKNLLQAAKLSEKSEESVQSAQSTIVKKSSNTNSNQEDNVKTQKVLKIKKLPKPVEEKKVEEVINKKVVEKRCIKTTKSSVKKTVGNNIIKKNETTEFVVKNNSTDGTKKSSSLKENRDTSKDIFKNEDQKYLHKCANLPITTNSKKLHSINDKKSIALLAKDCEKQKNAEKEEDLTSSINFSSITETNKIKNSVKKNTKSCLVIENTKICNQNMESLQTTKEKRKLVVKLGDSQKNQNIVENQKLQEVETRNNKEFFIDSIKKNEEDRMEQQVCEKKNIIKNKEYTSIKKENESTILNETKQVHSNSENVKKVKKVIKKVSKKKIQLGKMEEIEISNSQISNISSSNSSESGKNHTTAENILNKKTYSATNSNGIKNDNFFVISSHDKASSITNSHDINKNISSNEKVLSGEKACKEKVIESIDVIKIDLKNTNEDGSKNNNLSLLLQKSTNTLQKVPIISETNKHLNKELNKIERKKCIVRKKNVKKDESEIIKEQGRKNNETIKETVKQLMCVKKDVINELVTKNNDSEIIQHKKEGHKNNSNVGTKRSLSKNSLKKLTTDSKNDVISLKINLQSDLEDDDNDVFCFKNLRDKLEQRLSNKKHKVSIANDNINEKNKISSNDIFQCSGLSKVDFENVKNVKNKWLKIEKETFF